MMSSREEYSHNNTSFNSRRIIQRGFVLLTVWTIAYCVFRTKELEKVFQGAVHPEEMDLPPIRTRARAVPVKIGATKSEIERTLKENLIQTELLREEAKTKQQQIQKEQQQIQKERLNIVLFYADDWTMRVLGKLDPNVRTPNIDKMADNGMLFLNNCVTTSVCWISRATLMTGTYYSRHLQGKPSSETMFETHNWAETLFPKLKSAGYYTGLFGKWHSPSPKQKMKKAFDEFDLYFGHHWMPKGDGTMQHVTDKNRQDAIKFLENRPKDKNFALKVSFFATHAQDNHIPSYMPMNWSRTEIYPDSSTHKNFTTIVPPKTATDQHWKDLPWFFSDHNTGRGRWKKRWEPHVWQKNIRDLFAMATEVDWAIGEIIKVLKKQGVYDNTLLVFTTDNGDLHGEHGLAEKWYPMEESIKVPLVIMDPRMPAKHHGSMNTDWTLNVDLAPTLLGAAGLEPASFMQGRDIAQLYLSNETEAAQNENKRWKNNIARYDTKEARKPWRHEWFYEWNMGEPADAKGHLFDGSIDAAFALITNEWKYIYWPLKVYEQLFHRSVDKYDEHDILQNYYLHKHKIKNNIWVEEQERYRMETFTPQNTTPFGDSVESTSEIYELMKTKYNALKKHVQSGGKI